MMDSWDRRLSSLALKSGGSAVQDIIDKTTRIEAQAADVQKELDGVNARIKGEKAQKVALEGDVKNLEDCLASAEQDRANKDDQIRTLKDEIAHQGDMISKLSKEKRNVGDSRQKTEEDIQAAEDKCNHLSRVKGKLEQALDEAEDALEREKKVKGDVEKAKRKVEGAAARKDKEGSALAAKIDDEATLGTKYAKQAKELQARLEELDEELAVERGNRSKAEKSRTMLKKDIEDIASRLEEAGSNTATQAELNKKREGELARLKAELEELNI